MLGVTFQSDTRFNIHVKNKLTKANKSLHVLRALRREGCNKKEIVYLFNSIVLPNISYGLAVYGAAEAELTTIQRFLDRYIIKRSAVGTSRIALISTIF